MPPGPDEPTPPAADVPRSGAEDEVRDALRAVVDPELGDTIVDLGMVRAVTVAGGDVVVDVALTIAACPLRSQIERDVVGHVQSLDWVRSVEVRVAAMDADERAAVMARARWKAREDAPETAVPASARVLAIASGKGGVGKSSVTVNLAVALAASGAKVGIADADIYGHSVPRMLGVTGTPTQVEKMIMPPSAHGVKVISIGMFTKGNAPVVWRGPMLHRALQQFLADVYWGDLDVLLLDLPPGTGDIAISVAQFLPSAELLVVTTPQIAAAEVAERAGALATQTHQRIAGVIENMSYLVCPHCGEHTDIFGSGGGETVAAALTRITGAQVPLLGQVPMDTRLREGSDQGHPLVLSDPSSPAAAELTKIAAGLNTRARSLAGRSLPLSPI